MSARIFVLCLLSSIISIVAPLKCEHCFATEKCRNEDMELMECASDKEHCLTLSFRSTMITPSLSYTFHGCGSTEDCLQEYYSITSLDKKYIQLNVACCQSDGCNAAPLPLPSRNVLRPNMLLCSGSYQQNGVSVEGYGPILCLGNENQCSSANFTLQALSTFNSVVVVQGCATSSVCSYPKGETTLADGLLYYNLMAMECQNAVKHDKWKSLTMKNKYGGKEF